ncbi:MAG: Mur ligase family protein, partial [Pseudomonadota bacterium]
MQTALMIVLYLSLLALCWRRLLTLLNYFQQEEYDNARFVGAWARIRLMDVAASLLVLGSVMVSLSAPVATPYAHAALSAALLAIAYREGRRRFKKPLALTERARRILGLALGFAALLGLLSVVHVVFVALTLQALPFLLIAANAALRPLQNRINKRYLDEGRAKLERLNPLKIGVTGSFGKTTVKHMLGEIIEASGPVFYSRGSINTELGHTRHIRQRLQWAHRYFIAEMGAYGVGSIARLCAFIKPDHGIVTAVGDAHTERFGSIEAIARAKSELVEAVCRAGGVAVVNADVLAHEPFADLRAQYPANVLSVGGAGADVEVSAREIEGGSWAISPPGARSE